MPPSSIVPDVRIDDAFGRYCRIEERNRSEAQLRFELGRVRETPKVSRWLAARMTGQGLGTTMRVVSVPDRWWRGRMLTR